MAQFRLFSPSAPRRGRGRRLRAAGVLLPAVLAGSMLCGGCRAGGLGSGEAVSASVEHWPVTPAPSLRTVDPVLLVGLAARLGPAPGMPLVQAAPLELEAARAAARVLDLLATRAQGVAARPDVLAAVPVGVGGREGALALGPSGVPERVDGVDRAARRALAQGVLVPRGRGGVGHRHPLGAGARAGAAGQESQELRLLGQPKHDCHDL